MVEAKAYAVVRVTVTDPARYETYKTLAAASIAAAGGRYPVRGGAVTTAEGAEDPRRLVVLEFPSRAALDAWYDGPAYRAAREARAGAAEMDIAVVDGWTG